MKIFKISVLFFIFFSKSLLFSESSLLDGIWQGNDRIIYFFSSDEQQSFEKPIEMALTLKCFYQWYYDRALEPISFSSYKRPLNCATPLESEKIKVTYENLFDFSHENSEILESEKSSGAFQINLEYSDKSISKIPVAIIDDKLYLSFLIKRDDFSGEPRENSDLSQNFNRNDIYGFWQGIGSASGITISETYIASEITSLYITENAIYHIRYWQTDMEFSSESASFSDGNKTYLVAKHIQSAGKTYTCVSGRSLKIRNAKASSVNLENYVLNEDSTILALKTPYLTKLSSDTDNLTEKYIKIIQETNKKHHKPF